ncbi:GNAT family N-acetyltransferase [Microbacterium sp. p3-SID336]|uniref:GNAT family N-acetyltransferase n=1 Tax=Microbacterium sp. p3-SID336 TaxID=2916212 RepID=UPI0021A79159|nr:GNAT family N-acetyltransferase [Microbacterium sp. p3-SID336]MCT1477749.1 GNAT family N-acetyltransferase [Microbacterium sp. p3-SID336]
MESSIRTFRAGDGPEIAQAWTEAAPADGISYDRFRDLILLDRNFDADGLFLAEADGAIVGAVYAVRRQIAADGDDLEPTSGWIPFFFVVPSARRQGIATTLMTAAKSWLRDKGVQTVYFSSYTPNYFLPGLDADRYPEADAFLRGMGFQTQYTSVAMDRTLNDYAMPDDVRARIAEMRAEGWTFFSPSGDDLVDLIEIAGTFNADWSRGIREGVLGGQALERIMVCRDPEGTMLGWAMHGTYENVLERFGPFGVLPESRGTGLGKILLHLTLERMRALGAHSAWFLWTEETSAAGHLYLKTGFEITRTFTILHAPTAA